mmetsp:Transcript_52275/g.106541  ORF Transcript_52275/g.106541 Transcript_52275/m.106541 type:complete len:83 (-) Transcript_52275:18-266(-)
MDSMYSARVPASVASHFKTREDCNDTHISTQWSSNKGLLNSNLLAQHTLEDGEEGSLRGRISGWAQTGTVQHKKKQKASSYK